MAGMVYFGLSLSGASLSDNPYVYMVLSGLMEVPAYTLCAPIVQRFGRKRTLAVFFLTSAIVLVGLAIVPSSKYYGRDGRSIGNGDCWCESKREKGRSGSACNVK